MNDSTKLKISAILALAAIEVANLCTMKLDGALLTVIVGAIAGLGGYEIGRASRDGRGL